MLSAGSILIMLAPRRFIQGLETLHPPRAIEINLEKINGDVAQARLPSAHGILLFQDSVAPHQQLPASSGPSSDLPWPVFTCVHA